MVIGYLNRKKVLLLLLKDFSSTHTITSLSRELGFTRVGMWKIIKGLEKQEYIALKAVGKGRTSTGIAALNWENTLLGKTLSLYLAEEAMRQKRWQVNFGELERFVDFAILYGSIIISPGEAHDVDIVIVSKKQNFVKIQLCIDHVQKTQAKKIHSLQFTEGEFKAELGKPNKAFIEAIKKGVILFGQENFVMFLKGVKQ